MSNVLETIMTKAAALNKNIVLPEGEDKRVVEAASKLLSKAWQELLFWETQKKLLKTTLALI